MCSHLYTSIFSGGQSAYVKERQKEQKDTKPFHQHEAKKKADVWQVCAKCMSKKDLTPNSESDLST